MTGYTEPEPNEALRTFGAVLQGFREAAGLTQDALGPKVGYSAHFVASVEQGRRLAPCDFVDGAESALDARGVIRKAARKLARSPGLAAWFRQWAGLEENAVSLSTYESRLVPGLLQTEAYARALFLNRVPPLTDDEVEAQWTARSERQRLLTERPNTNYSFILEEHLFLRRLGGDEVTRELIEHMLAIARRGRNVEIQLMPLVHESHAGLNGPIRLLEAPDHAWVAYSEGQETGHLISDPKAISRLHSRYAKLRSQALTPQDSVRLLEQLRGAL